MRELKSILSGNVGIMALSWFLFSLSSALVQPFFTLYARELGADNFSIAVVRSLGMIALAIALIPGGLLTDYVGRVKLIIIGTLGVTIAQFAYACVRSWSELAVVWVLDEVIHFYQPALTAIVMDSLPKDKTLKGFLLLQAFPSIPWLFMPAVGGYLYEVYGVLGIRFGFVISGVISALVTLLRLKGFKETLTMRNERNFSYIIKDFLNHSQELKKAFKIYVYTAFLSPLTMGVFNTYGSIYAVTVLGVGKAEWGVVSSLAMLTAILTSLSLTLTPIKNYLKLLVIGSSLIASAQVIATLPIVLNVNSFLTILTTAIAVQAGVTLLNPTISSILTKILQLEIRGRAVGIQRALETLGGALGSFVAGVIYTSLGPANSLLISALFGLISLIYLVFIYKSV